MIPIDVTCALIRRGNRILAARRPAGPHLGLQWEFPGGKLHEDESPEACIVREIREELAIRVQPVGRLEEVVHRYEEKTVRLIPLLCEVLEGEPEAREHAEIRWVEAEESDRLDWCAADRPVLREWLDRHARNRRSSPDASEGHP